MIHFTSDIMRLLSYLLLQILDCISTIPILHHSHVRILSVSDPYSSTGVDQWLNTEIIATAINKTTCVVNSCIYIMNEKKITLSLTFAVNVYVIFGTWSLHITLSVTAAFHFRVYKSKFIPVWRKKEPCNLKVDLRYNTSGSMRTVYLVYDHHSGFVLLLTSLLLCHNHVTKSFWRALADIMLWF